MMALTLAEGESPAAALNSFLSQEGMEGGQTSSVPVNGIPAAAANFRFTTQEGTLQGRVVFLAHGGTVLRFLGFGPVDAWRTREELVRESLESFRVLEDQNILDVQPARIRVITVPREMDLATFLSGEGASDRVEHVRLLNRLQGNRPLPAGRVLKVPVGGRLPGGE
jgi:predicted Zn-dependent protease